ncbi:MAG TPA: hypothetical protein VER04_23275 [Polyangiaceae bacterium]|nr:hypothetical protein [Polyangiaceae bacterium]
MARAYFGGRPALPTATLALLLCHCGPHHEGGGSGGSSPAGGASSSGAAGSSGSGTEGGEGPSAGTAGSGSANTAGSSGTNTGGSAGSGVAGTAGGPTSPATEAVIGCQAAPWPDAGYFFEAPPVNPYSERREGLLARFSPDGISGDGKLVVGHTDEPPQWRGIPLAWTTADGVEELPFYNGYTYATQASCDGSAFLLQTSDNQAFRLEAGQELVSVLPFLSSQGIHLHTNPDLSVIVNGGFHANPNGDPSDMPDAIPPLRWTATSGYARMDELIDYNAYGVSPNGNLLVAGADALYRYDVTTHVKTPVGMSPVDRGYGWRSFASSADGNAWAQAADLHYDSFLVWRAGAEPLSVTCPNPCRIRDISGTGQVVLLDVQFVADVSDASSWIWTEKTGLVDLTTLFEQNGFSVSGRKLIAAALSDDGRAFTGNIYAPPPALWSEYQPFFYAVLPKAAYE